ncbi:hypothetical protein F511_24241 [Dorcoceras hygrometricum]|uniref:Uncharacterized protein n=1 Tax=Dorcoceras hygrometricum TaxID=472368 RepID=A0A2Z7AG94_9LAMI|nr:hypothetical protein F511_24241 [Dorcoceras hygrometricum]
MDSYFFEYLSDEDEDQTSHEPLDQFLPPKTTHTVSEEIMKKLDAVDGFFEFNSSSAWQYPSPTEEEQQLPDDTLSLKSPHDGGTLMREEFLKVLGEISECLESKISCSGRVESKNPIDDQETLMREEFLKVLGEIDECLGSKITCSGRGGSKNRHHKKRLRRHQRDSASDLLREELLSLDLDMIF